MIDNAPEQGQPWQDGHHLTVWVLGQVKSQDGSVWEIGGVFSTRARAVAACSDPWDCVFPMKLDEVLSRETVESDDLVYPLAQGAPQQGLTDTEREADRQAALARSGGSMPPANLDGDSVSVTLSNGWWYAPGIPDDVAEELNRSGGTRG